MATRIGVMFLGRSGEVAARAQYLPASPLSLKLLEAVPDLEMSAGSAGRSTGEFPTDRAAARVYLSPAMPVRADRCRTDEPRTIAAGQAVVACHGGGVH